MGIIIKGDVKGDIITEGGVKNETHYHYGNESKVEQQMQNKETLVSATSQNTTNVVQSPSRTNIVDELMDLIDRGKWVNTSCEAVKEAMHNLLEDEQAETMWRLLEGGRGDRLRVTWQNMIGYFAGRRMLPTSIGSPALNDMFFGDTNNYSNIDKGKYEDRMSSGFHDVLPLLDKYFPL